MAPIKTDIESPRDIMGSHGTKCHILSAYDQDCGEELSLGKSVTVFFFSFELLLRCERYRRADEKDVIELKKKLL